MCDDTKTPAAGGSLGENYDAKTATSRISEVSEHGKLMEHDYGKVTNFLDKADAEWKEGAKRARKYGRSNTIFFDQLPVWNLFEYTNGGIEDPHVAILEAHWLERHGGIEKKCTGRHHCPYKKLDCFQ